MDITGIDKTDSFVLGYLLSRYGNVKKVKDVPRYRCGENFSIRVEPRYSYLSINGKPVVAMQKKHISKMKDDDIMIVVSDNNMVEFKWSERNKHCILNAIDDRFRIIVNCSKETYYRYKKIESMLETKGEKTIVRLIELAEQKIRETEKNKKFETI